MFYIVPVIDQKLDIDYLDLLEGIQTRADACHVRLRDDALVRESWQEITEEEFNQIKESLLAPSE